MVDELRGALVANRLLRFVYSVVKRAPGGKALLQPVASWLVPRSRRLHARVGSGLAKNLVILVDPRYSHEYIRGNLDPWLQKLMSDSLQPGGVYVDVGAHIGFFVLCAARVVGKDGRIVALEPDPDNFAGLSANIEINSLNQVVALKIAAWSSSTTLIFKRSSAASGLSEGRVIGEAVDGEPPDQLWQVDGVTLDRILTDPPGLVKIDVEGAEVDVLFGAERLLSARQTVWVVECHTLGLALTVERIFRSHEYAVDRLDPPDSAQRVWTQIYLIARPGNRWFRGEGSDR